MPCPAHLLRWAIFVPFLSLSLGLAIIRPALPASQDDAEIDKLIGQLGDDDPAKRRDAVKRLEEVGEPAIVPLRKTAKAHADPDVRLRAGVIAAAIEKKLYAEVRRFEGHKGWVFRVALTPDGKKAVSTGDAIRVWDVETGKQLGVFGQGLAGYGLAVSSDGKRILCNDIPSKTVRLWELEKGKEIQKYQGHTGEVWVAAFCPDGKHALTGAWDATLRLWDLDSGKQVRQMEGVRDWPRCVAFAQDGKHFAVGHHTPDGSRGTVRLWELESGKEVRAFTGHTGAITAVEFSPDGKQLLSSSFDKTIRLWDVETGREVRRFEGHPGAVDYVAFLKDGKRFLSCGYENDNTVRLWDVAAGKEIHRYEGHTQAPIAVVVTPDGRHAISSGKDGTLRMWPLPK
jgi:WD40 repeat protein